MPAGVQDMRGTAIANEYINDVPIIILLITAARVR